MVHTYTIIKRVSFLLLIVLLGNPLWSQCTSDFTYQNRDLLYQFSSRITEPANDAVIEVNWDFGDGNSSNSLNPMHEYTTPGEYEVQLAIRTANNCRDTARQIIRNCAFELDVEFSEECSTDGNVEVAARITKLFGLTDTVDIYVDDSLYTRQPIDSVLNYNFTVPGDGLLHSLTVDSDYAPDCLDAYLFNSTVCQPSCLITNLKSSLYEKHIVTVTDSTYRPMRQTVAIGDTVQFVWAGDSINVTSQPLPGSDFAWDSGILSTGDSYTVIFTEPGTFNYTGTVTKDSTTTTLNGMINVNCFSLQTVNLSFNSAATSSPGYRVAINGFVQEDTLYAYDSNGFNMLDVEIVPDGNAYTLSIIDEQENQCQASTIVQSQDCDQFQSCDLRVDVSTDLRCSEELHMGINVSINSLGITAGEAVLVYLDNQLIDTVYVDETGNAFLSFDAENKLSSRTVKVESFNNSSCTESAAFDEVNCSGPCLLTKLELSQGVRSEIPTYYIGANSLTQIETSADQGLRLVWDEGDYGMRLTGDHAFDTGIRKKGSIYYTPNFSPGSYSIQLYKEDGSSRDISIEVLSPCDEGLIPVYYSFVDLTRTTTSYTVSINGQPFYKNIPYNAFGSKNEGVVKLYGDDRMYTISIKDDFNSCVVMDTIYLAQCDSGFCDIQVDVVSLDTCFNNNDHLVEFQVKNKRPFPGGYTLMVDRKPFGPSTLEYELFDSISTYVDTLFGDGLLYEVVAQDKLNPLCQDTLYYRADKCVTDCELSNIEITFIDSAYQAQNPEIGSFFVGCLADTTHYAAITFYEKYSDAKQYNIFIDGELYAGVDYLDGDGKNIALVPLPADSLEHTVTITDNLDNGCTISQKIVTPKCFVDCVVDIKGFSFGECADEVSTLSVVLNDEYNKDDLNVQLDGSNVAYSISGDTLQVDVRADGKSHMLTIQETANMPCIKELTVTSPYCLTCLLDMRLNRIDSCSVDDSLSYVLTFSGDASLAYTLTYGDVTESINIAEPKTISVVSDGSTVKITVASVEDPLCNKSETIRTEDCNPAFCEPDFNLELDGLKATFTDNSKTSEPIKETRWSVTGGVSVLNSEKFTFIFDSIGVYNVCYMIKTDSCDSEICKDVVIDPCRPVVPAFTYDHTLTGFHIYNQSTGPIDSFYFDLGDGRTIMEDDFYIEYATSGSYSICLTVINDKHNCQNTVCQDVDYVVSVKDPAEDVKLLVYPNPLQSDNKINIESSIGINAYALYTTSGQLLEGADLARHVKKLSVRIYDNPSDGIVILKLRTDKGEFVRKVLTR